MKKVTVLILVFLSIVTFLFGGGRSDASGAQQMTLTMWSGNNNINVDAPVTGSAEFMRKTFSDFEAAHPGVKIDFQMIPGNTEALPQILAAAAANNLPDLAAVDGFWLARLVEQNVLRPLDKYWPASDQADFPREVIEADSFNGKPYAVHLLTAIRCIMYRKDILKMETGLDVLPTEREEFLKVLTQLKKPGRWSIMYPTDTSEMNTLHMWPVFWGYGGSLADATGKPIFHEGANREALKKTYQWYYDLANVYELMPKEGHTHDDMTNYFYSDQAFAVAYGSSFLAALKQNRPDLYENLGFINYPMEEGLRAVPHLVGWTYGITTTDPSKEQMAWNLIAALSNTEAMRTFNEVNGYIPIRKSVAETSTFYKTDKIFSQIMDIQFGGPTRARPAVGTYPVISLAIAEQLNPILSGRISIENAIDAAAKIAMEDYERSRR